jgi:hypothetical protein
MHEENEDYVPQAGEAVLVRCTDFTCVGFRDEEGRWYEYFSGQELMDVLSVEKLSEIEKIVTLGTTPRPRGRTGHS